MLLGLSPACVVQLPMMTMPSYPCKVKGISVNELETCGLIKYRPQVIQRVSQLLCGITPGKDMNAPQMIQAEPNLTA